MSVDPLGLEITIDARLADLWTMLWHEDGVLRDAMSDEQTGAALTACLRYAYGRGYKDALAEDKAGRRGELATRHGYRIA